MKTIHIIHVLRQCLLLRRLSSFASIPTSPEHEKACEKKMDEIENQVRAMILTLEREDAT